MEIADDRACDAATLAAYQELVNSPETRAKLLNALAAQRRKWSAEQNDDMKPTPSDVIRFNWLR